MKRGVLLLSFAVLLLGALQASALAAQEYSGGGFLLDSNWIGGRILSTYHRTVGPVPSPYFLAAYKLGRGMANVFSGPVELVKQPLLEMEKARSVGEFFALFFEGVAAGIPWTFYRTSDGLYEIATFYLPSLGPAITPEFIF